MTEMLNITHNRIEQNRKKVINGIKQEEIIQGGVKQHKKYEIQQIKSRLLEIKLNCARVCQPTTYDILTYHYGIRGRLDRDNSRDHTLQHTKCTRTHTHNHTHARTHT